jgi:hypothetical protein
MINKSKGYVVVVNSLVVFDVFFSTNKSSSFVRTIPPTVTVDIFANLDVRKFDWRLNHFRAPSILICDKQIGGIDSIFRFI